MTTYRIAPEVQDQSTLAVDEHGKQEILAPDADAGVIVRNPDQTETLRTLSREGAYQDPLLQPGAEGDVSSRWVMRVAVKGLLETLTCYQVDGASRLKGETAGVRPFHLRRIFLSWPRPQDEAEPSPTVVVRVADRVTYSDRQTTTSYLEGTLGRWAPGTVLRKVARAVGQVRVMAWCGDPEQAEALESAIERAFLAEPSEDLVGRRIVVPQYYDQQARLSLVDIDDATTEEDVVEGRWDLVATVQVEIDRVILVKAPPSMETLIGRDVGPTVTINV